MSTGYFEHVVDEVRHDVDVDCGIDDAEQVEFLRTMEPGPTAILILRGLVTENLDVDARIEVAAAWQRQLAWLNAQAQTALADVIDDIPDRSAADDAEREWRSDLVAASLAWSPRSTAHRLLAARRLVSELPLTHGLLTAGEISFRHAWILADEVSDLSSEDIAAVEARVIERAPKQTVAQFTRSVRRAIIAVNPDLAAARRTKAVRLRGVRRVAYADGMAGVIATMEAADAETVYQALDAAARKAAAEAKTAGEAELPIDARRADALATWANDALADPDLPRRQGRRVELQIVIDLSTLLGMAENPAELIGYGPIPAAVARALAGEAGWRRLVTDPVDGHLLDYGTAIYRPSRRLVDYLVARDRRCRFPGCERQADACDIDHVCPAGKPGGKTAACNCCCLCRRHHRMKTHGGWSLELHDDGSVTWSSPSGYVFNVDPVGQLE